MHSYYTPPYRHTHSSYIQTDTSGVDLGVALNVIREGEDIPIAFYSRKLHGPEHNYSATELDPVLSSVL